MKTFIEKFKIKKVNLEIIEVEGIGIVVDDTRTLCPEDVVAIIDIDGDMSFYKTSQILEKEIVKEFEVSDNTAILETVAKIYKLNCEISEKRSLMKSLQQNLKIDTLNLYESLKAPKTMVESFEEMAANAVNLGKNLTKDFTPLIENPSKETLKATVETLKTKVAETKIPEIRTQDLAKKLKDVSENEDVKKVLSEGKTLAEEGLKKFKNFLK